MEEATLFDMPPWRVVGISALQTVLLYWLVLLGLKAVGRRVFGEKGPQDLMILVLIGEATNLGLAPQRAGFWGTVASVLTVLATGAVIERIPRLRDWLEGRPTVLLREGVLDEAALRDNLVSRDDLAKTARQYGLRDVRDFETVVLEGDGSLTGIPRGGRRTPRQQDEEHAAVG